MCVYGFLGNDVQRNLLDWGLVGQGDVVVGHMILVDLDSGEKVRVMPGTRIEEDRLFANTRNAQVMRVEFSD